MALVILWMSFGLLTGVVAHGKGSNPLLWLLIGVICGPFGLIACFIVGRSCPFCESKINSRITICPNCKKSVPPADSWKKDLPDNRRSD